jgi:hypothetical protein
VGIYRHESYLLTVTYQKGNFPAWNGRIAPSQHHRRSYFSPNSFHFLSTSALVFSSIWISSGQGRVKPSLGHLRVASMPIFDP